LPKELPIFLCLECIKSLAGLGFQRFSMLRFYMTRLIMPAMDKQRPTESMDAS